GRRRRPRRPGGRRSCAGGALRRALVRRWDCSPRTSGDGVPGSRFDGGVWGGGWYAVLCVAARDAEEGFFEVALQFAELDGWDSPGDDGGQESAEFFLGPAGSKANDGLRAGDGEFLGIPELVPEQF